MWSRAHRGARPASGSSWGDPPAGGSRQEAQCRCLRDRPTPSGRREPSRPAKLTVAALLNAYSAWACETYTASEVSTIAHVDRIARRMFGTTPAEEFGPNKLRLVREAMVSGDPHATPPRMAWSRKHVNGQVHRLCSFFKWAASHEMLPITVYQQLKSVPSLKRGRCDARESEPVRPVDEAWVHAVRPFVSRQVEALMLLQLFTGARGGELFKLRPRDIRIDETTKVWTVVLEEHKTAHHGKRRTIYLGPNAQSLLQPFLTGRAADAYLFSPREAEDERRMQLHARRKTPLSCGNRPGSNRREERMREPGEHFIAASYRKAIERACEKAFVPPEHLRRRVNEKGRKEPAADWRRRLGKKGLAELAAWRQAHRWHPHQLRHTAGTRIRREFGLEAAAVVLGHSSALVTDAVYAERDLTKVAEVMRRIG
jgi:integrase